MADLDERRALVPSREGYESFDLDLDVGGLDPRDLAPALSGSGDGTMGSGARVPGGPMPAWAQAMAMGGSEGAALKAFIYLLQFTPLRGVRVDDIHELGVTSQGGAAVALKAAEQNEMVENIAPRGEQKRYVATPRFLRAIDAARLACPSRHPESSRRCEVGRGHKGPHAYYDEGEARSVQWGHDEVPALDR